MSGELKGILFSAVLKILPLSPDRKRKPEKLRFLLNLDIIKVSKRLMKLSKEKKIATELSR